MYLVGLVGLRMRSIGIVVSIVPEASRPASAVSKANWAACFGGAMLCKSQKYQSRRNARRFDSGEP